MFIGGKYDFDQCISLTLVYSRPKTQVLADKLRHVTSRYWSIHQAAFVATGLQNML